MLKTQRRKLLLVAFCKNHIPDKLKTAGTADCNIPENGPSVVPDWKSLISSSSFFCIDRSPFLCLRSLWAVESGEPAGGCDGGEKRSPQTNQSKGTGWRKSKTPHLIANVYLMFLKGVSSVLFNNNKNLNLFHTLSWTLFSKTVSTLKNKESLFTWSSCTGVSRKRVGKSEASWTEQ